MSVFFHIFRENYLLMKYALKHSCSTFSWLVLNINLRRTNLFPYMTLPGCHYPCFVCGSWCLKYYLMAVHILLVVMFLIFVFLFYLGFYFLFLLFIFDLFFLSDFHMNIVVLWIKGNNIHSYLKIIPVCSSMCMTLHKHMDSLRNKCWFVMDTNIYGWHIIIKYWVELCVQMNV